MKTRQQIQHFDACTQSAFQNLALASAFPPPHTQQQPQERGETIECTAAWHSVSQKDALLKNDRNKRLWSLFLPLLITRLSTRTNARGVVMQEPAKRHATKGESQRP